MSPSRPWLSLLSDLYTPPSPEELRRENEAFGALLVDLGLASRRQVDDCLAAPARQDRPFPRLSRLLIDRGVITPDQLAASVIASAAENPENRIGPYVLVGRLRGETWKAWDTARRDWVQFTFVTLEEHERLVARRAVTHPGLVRILDLGSVDERSFAVAEHVQGISLATAPRSDRRALAVAIRDAAEAVAALHAKKLTHGAISLEAILLDDRGAARVTGWGTNADDARALGAALFEALTDRSAPREGAPKSWPKRLDGGMRSFLGKALSGGYSGAKPFAKDLSALL